MVDLRGGLYQTESLLGKKILRPAAKNPCMGVGCPVMEQGRLGTDDENGATHGRYFAMQGGKGLLDHLERVFGGDDPRMDVVYPRGCGFHPVVDGVCPGMDGGNSGVAAVHPRVAGKWIGFSAVYPAVAANHPRVGGK